MAKARTAKRSTSSARTSRGTRTNALTILRSDHETVDELFGRFEKLKEKGGSRQLQDLAAEICQELKIHAQIEEEIFYPAVRDECGDCEDLLDEAKVEHASLRHLIDEIETESDGQFAARVIVLAEYVRHHVREEQNELFPKVRDSDLDLAALGVRLELRKRELKGERVLIDRAAD
jgi:hemerythrin superfamily protein